MSRVDTTEGKIEMYEHIKALEPVIAEQKKGLPMPAQNIFDLIVPLRPANWWNEFYLVQLRQLSLSMYLMSFYQSKERDYAHKGDMAEAAKYSRQVASSLAIVKHLQPLLQLTPSQVNGQARNHLGALEVDGELRSLDDTPQDSANLYAH